MAILLARKEVMINIQPNRGNSDDVFSEWEDQISRPISDLQVATLERRQTSATMTPENASKTPQ
jgi:hypothetical protein